MRSLYQPFFLNTMSTPNVLQILLWMSFEWVWTLTYCRSKDDLSCQVMAIPTIKSFVYIQLFREIKIPIVRTTGLQKLYFMTYFQLYQEKQQCQGYPWIRKVCCFCSIFRQQLQFVFSRMKNIYVLIMQASKSHVIYWHNIRTDPSKFNLT